MKEWTRGLRLWRRWFVGEAPLPQGRVRSVGIAIAVVLVGITGLLFTEADSVGAHPAAAVETTTTYDLPLSSLTPPSTAALPFTSARSTRAVTSSPTSTSASSHPGHHLHRARAKAKAKAKSAKVAN